MAKARCAQGGIGLADHFPWMDLGDLQWQGRADDTVVTEQIAGKTLQVNSVRVTDTWRLGMASAKARERNAHTERA